MTTHAQWQKINSSDDFGSESDSKSSEASPEKCAFCHSACVVENSHDDRHKHHQVEICLVCHT